MRLVFTIVSLLSFVPLAGIAQVATATTCSRAIYQVNYKIDSAVTVPKSERMILRINNGISCYKSIYKHVHDSVYASLNSLQFTDRANAANNAAMKTYKAAASESAYSIFKEAAKDLVYYHDDIRTVLYRYQEKAPLFHWKIMSVSKIVAGYPCQQAFSTFGGRTWEAWFTRDIPVSEGPYKFYGLPGLIVKVRDTHDHYVFELLSFENNARPFTLSVTSSAPLIKKVKFKQAKLNDDLTLVDQLTSWGNKIPESMQQKYLTKIKRRNNPMELK